MSNTIISLKKSSTPSAKPASLEFGELAINYSDGKLYYKNTNSQIAEISGSGGGGTIGDNFSTINANSVLIIADTTNDILTLEQGDNIIITGDAINDKITISANIAPAYDKANSALPNTSGVSFAGNLYFPTGNVGIGTNSPTERFAVEHTSITLPNGANTFSAKIQDSNNDGLTGGFLVSSFLPRIALNDRSTSANWFDFRVDTSKLIIGYGENTDLFSRTADALTITDTGNVGIGTSSPSYPLDVNGNINSSNTVFAVHFDNVSDISLKDNVLPLDNITKTLNQLNPVSFTWKNNGQKSYGLIAQEVEQILPTIVHTKSDGTKTVNYIEIIAFLIAEVKSLRQEIDVINTINNKSKESS